MTVSERQRLATFDPADIGRLRHDVIGDCLLPEDRGYDEHRQVYNAGIDRQPAIVVVCEGQSDVQAAVRFARANELPVAVRGGGHSVAGHGTCDQGVLVDLRRMRGVVVSPATGQVWVQGGATLRDLDAQTQLFGLAVPTGQVSATGIGGLALGGGLGMLQRRFGLTCDNLVQARVVTADGELITAAADEHPELLWALKGGGGNFGVITDFCFQAHPVGPIMLSGMIAWPIDRSHEVLNLLDRVIADAPEELSADIIVQFAPPLEVFPPELLGRHLIGIFVRWSGSIPDGQAVVQSFRDLDGIVLDLIQPVPLVEVQRMLDPLNPNGHSHRWTGQFIPRMDDEAIETLHRLGTALPTPMCIIEVIPFNGAVTRIDPDATAFSHRSESWLIHILGQWADPADEERVTGWVARAKAELGRIGAGQGAYLNLISEEDETGERVDAFWNDQRMARLSDVKSRYDPENTFRFNANISPAPTTEPQEQS